MKHSLRAVALLAWFSNTLLSGELRRLSNGSAHKSLEADLPEMAY
ncbi:hypothetical protein Pla8534_00590 [Lignipirellula cremea]|uniref:Uncharacterized protein n=1 Tax=Lignipirellula cremea TaxID=2528010 RepID=A0A518DKF2_9BACT|nr:hypothetical protein Pla8534_00590 [Lignipirellula cremea]